MPIVGYPGWVDALKNGEALTSTIDGYNSVPMLYRAVNLRCDAISSVPYHILRKEVEVEWPWVQSFTQLIKETERALLLTGSAFWLKLKKSNVLTGFQVLNPQTVTVKFDASKALPGNPFAGVTFTQQFRGVTFGPWSMDEVVYFREPSMTDEVGPGLAPARVALQSAQLAHYLERFASHFFEGGAQPVTIMNLPENMDEAEFQRFKGEWGKFSGVLNAFRTAFVRSPEIKATVITPPIKDLMLPELQERVITTIAMTLGVPRTMLEASAANYATADSDRQSFWRETIVPRLSLYEHIINTQLFSAIGYAIEFHPDELDVMQADEAARAGSLKLLVEAGMPLRGAMKTLGYKNIEETLAMTQPGTEQPEIVVPPPDSTDSEELPLAALRAIEFGLLAKKIERRIKSLRDPRCLFISQVITDTEVKSIMARLSSESTVSDVVAVITEVKALDKLTPNERRIYDAIAPELAKRGATWASDIIQGNPVDPTLKDVIAPVLKAEMAMQMGKRIDTLGTQFNMPMDAGAQSQRVTDWLGNYVPMTTARIDQTTADRIKPIIETYRTTAGMTINDLTTMLMPLSDGVRARMIAVTETTRAAAQATVEYQQFLGKAGVNFIRVWNTDNDERVCPICTGEAYGVDLDGLTEDQWPAEVGSGPPAHVNCRCDTSLRLVKDNQQVQPPVVQPVAQPTVIQPVAQPPSTTTTPVLQMSAAEIADFIRQAVPPDLARDAHEFATLYTPGGIHETLIAARQLALTQHGLNSPEYTAAANKYYSEIARISALQPSIARREEAIYIKVLGELQHPNPQTVQVRFMGSKMTTEQENRVRELIELSFGVAPTNGFRPWITYNATVRTDTISGSFGSQTITGRRVDNVMSAHPDTDASTIVHESMHGLQGLQRYGIRACDAFGDTRTSGEKPVTLRSQYYNTPGKTYLDNTDSAYTFRVYDSRLQQTNGKWPEVLTTAIDNIASKPLDKDTGLLELFAQIIKDGG